MSFANLKKQSGNLDKLAKAIEQLNSSGGNSKEDNFWKPEVDKAGNGYAVIRFLPSPSQDGDEGLPWVKLYDHGFQGPGGWYIENSLTTLNQKDPVSEYNSQLWNSGVEANKEIARKQKRRLSYISNIYVIEDPKNPDNEGKVFLFKFGKKIFEKINEAMNPQFEDEKAFNPFDLWNGADFKLKIRNVDGYRNYDKAEFASTATLGGFSDDKLEAVWKQEHSLKDFLSDSNFKSYDELKSRLDRVLGLSENASRPKTTVERAKAAPKEVEKQHGESASADEDDLEYFSRLSEEE